MSRVEGTAVALGEVQLELAIRPTADFDPRPRARVFCYIPIPYSE